MTTFYGSAADLDTVEMGGVYDEDTARVLFALFADDDDVCND